MLTNVAAKKEIMIGETGWASAGKNENASIASPANLATYLMDFYNFANQRNLKYFYFAAFDDSYKNELEGKENDVEGHFGLYTSDGVLKPMIETLVITKSAIDPDNTNITVAPTVLKTVSPTPRTDDTKDSSSSAATSFYARQDCLTIMLAAATAWCLIGPSCA